MKKHFTGYAIFVSLTAALAGLLFGMDTGAISGALPLIQSDFHIRDGSLLLGTITAMLLLGAAVGVLLSSSISYYFGRKLPLLLSSLLFVVCSLVLLVTTHLGILITCRFLLGLALGISSYIAPIYLAEIAPAYCRGAMIATFQLMITIGLLVAFLTDTYFASAHLWHQMLGVVAIPSAVLFFMTLALPDSPRWLLLQGRSDQARAVLSRLVDDAYADDEMHAIQKSVDHKGMGLEVFANPYFLKLLVLGLVMQCFQQWTGINAVMYYAPLLFKHLGFQTLTAQMWCSVAVGLVNVLTTVVAIMLIDRWGRRPILFFGLTLILFALLTPVVASHIAPFWPYLGWLNLVAVLVYIVGFAVSLGPIVWIICAEVFPLRMRDLGVMVTTCGNWVFNALLGLAFPTLLAAFGIHALFVTFAVIALLAVIYIYHFVPETKGVPLEVLEENLYQGRALRRLGRQSE